MKNALDELRKRLVISLLSVLVGFLVAVAFSEAIFDFMMRPMTETLPPGGQLIFTEPTEGFFLRIKMSALAGLILAVPVVLSQFWLFVTPGLYSHERKLAVPFHAKSHIDLFALCQVGSRLWSSFSDADTGFFSRANRCHYIDVPYSKREVRDAGHLHCCRDCYTYRRSGDSHNDGRTHGGPVRFEYRHCLGIRPAAGRRIGIGGNLAALVHESKFARPDPDQRRFTDRCRTTLACPGRSSDSGGCTRGVPRPLALLECGLEGHPR